MRKIKWGILGPGVIARQFAHDFQFSKYGELISVASRSKERSEKFAKEYDIPKHYGNYEDLYTDPDIDIIYVATPHNFHFEQSKAALTAGKSVLCEKPLTISPAECEDLIAIANSSDKYLMEGMWTYFLPALIKAQEWISKGHIGTIRHVKSNFGYAKPFEPNGRMYNPDLAGGALLDMGCYTIAMAWLFCKTDPKNIHVVAHKAPTGVDDDVSVVFEYDNDVIANLNTSFRCKMPNWTYIIGDQGYIGIPDFWRASECYLYKGEKLVKHYIDNRQGYGFNFESDAASLDLMEGKKQSDIMTHAYSLKLQEHMYEVMKRF